MGEPRVMCGNVVLEVTAYCNMLTVNTDHTIKFISKSSKAVFTTIPFRRQFLKALIHGILSRNTRFNTISPINKAGDLGGLDSSLECYMLKVDTCVQIQPS